RNNNPLIHHLINQVVMNFVANGLLSFGASPVMAKAKEEAKDMASGADGVFINIGTLTKEELPAMIAAGKVANEHEKPVVLDPVGVAATPFRSEAIQEIMQHVQPTVIKGNAGEFAHLVDIPWEVKGVDSTDGGNIMGDIAQQAAKKYATAVVVTGKTDFICTGDHVFENTTGHPFLTKDIISRTNEVGTGDHVFENTTGHPFLTKVTGGGCLLGSVITACLTTDDSIEDQLLAAVTFYGLAAEYAATHEDVAGPGSFMPRFIDALSYDVRTLQGRL